MKYLVCCTFLIFGLSAQAEAAHPCAADAVKKAKLLLLFHTSDVDTRDQTSVEDSVKVLAPLRNPGNRQQLFDVLQVEGHVYRANFQIRLIYARLPGECALMGQEIIDRSSL